MALRLRVVSDHRRQLGPRSAMSFGPGGGTIGRGADHDWVLPDPQRYLSGRHACIRFQNGGYYLEDTSTNGIYVNDAEQPISKRAPHELHDGDLLRFGEYQIIASIDVTMELAAEPSAIISVDRVNGTDNALPEQPGDLGASLNLQALLAADSSPSDSFGPVDAFGQSAGVSIGRPRAEDHEPSEDSIARRLARLARAAGARERANAPALYDVASGLQAFCRGAGIDPETLPADAQTRLLHLAGQLCREALLGLKDLERSQQELRNRFRIESPRDPEDPRPMLASGSIEELLTRLLAGHEVRRADAVQWLRDEFDRAKSHESAVAGAMRTAFVEFIGRLAPDELDSRFERAVKRGLLAAGKAQPWSLYRDFYRSLTEMPADHLPHLFVETFADAYRRLRDSN